MIKRFFLCIVFIGLITLSVAFADPPVTEDLTLWLDASRNGTITSEDGNLDHGDRISAWQDILTGDNTSEDDFIQNDPANRPVWFEKIQGRHGTSAVLFDGTKTFLSSNSLYIGPQTTVFIVAQNAIQLNTPGSVHRPLLAADNNPFRPDGTGYGISYQYPGSRELIVSLGNGTIEEKIIAENHNLQDWSMNIILFRRNGVKDSQIFQRTIRDSENILKGDQLDLTRTTGLYTGYELGAETGHQARYYKGFISEILIYNRPLNDTETKQVSDYLYNKHFEVSNEDPFDAMIYLPFENNWYNYGELITEKGDAVTYNDITPGFGTGIRGKSLDLSQAQMSNSAGCVLYGSEGTKDTLLEKNLNNAHSITLCGWFNANEPMKAFSGFLGRMGQLMVRCYDNDSKIVLGINNNWTPTDNSIVFNESGLWTFWAVTYDGTQSSNNVNWYKGDIHGNFNHVQNQSLNAGPLAEVHDQLAVGNLLTSGAYSFSGLLDEFRIFTSQIDSSGALEPSQLQNIYEHGRSPYCGDSRHPYPLGDINNDCVVDLEDLAEFVEHWQVDVN
jgi:hypothetical protein